MKAYGEWRYSSTHSFTSVLDGGEWSESRPGRFTPRERDPGTHWLEGCLGPRAVLDAVVKRKIHSLRRESNPRTPIVQLLPQRYTDWTITALIKLLQLWEKLQNLKGRSIILVTVFQYCTRRNRTSHIKNCLRYFESVKPTVWKEGGGWESFRYFGVREVNTTNWFDRHPQS
jgi:hypothetical protein